MFALIRLNKLTKSCLNLRTVTRRAWTNTSVSLANAATIPLFIKSQHAQHLYQLPVWLSSSKQGESSGEKLPAPNLIQSRFKFKFQTYSKKGETTKLTKLLWSRRFKSIELQAL
jgi:hypothetical protein